MLRTWYRYLMQQNIFDKFNFFKLQRHIFLIIKLIFPSNFDTEKGSTTYNVMVLGGGRGNQGLCDISTKAIVLRSVTNHPKLRDVIYGRSQRASQQSYNCDIQMIKSAKCVLRAV
jgi:hypothetical protein